MEFGPFFGLKIAPGSAEMGGRLGDLTRELLKSGRVEVMLNGLHLGKDA